MAIVAVFVALYYLPVVWLQSSPRLENALWEALSLAKWYAREHVLLCLVPAFFIAGAVGVFVSQAAVMKYLGPRANKILAYGVASVSGSILAVCSCTILPLFAGIYRMGAGLGPASAFLYSGPAINILAIVLTAAVLGPEMGMARAVGAVGFSVVIGLLMHLFFRREELEKVAAAAAMPEPEVSRPLWQNALFFAVMVGILVFANWGKPAEPTGLWQIVYASKWPLTGLFALGLAVILVLWFGVSYWRMLAVVAPALICTLVLPRHPELAFVAATVGLTALLTTSRDGDGELAEWFDTSWDFAKKILPLLLWGVLIAGALLGRPDHEGLIPSSWIADLVGGNSMWANLFASVVGAFMYFATLTEVPIL
ncbi:MAG TPA: permease, partial [Geothermobacteraceae bacterium]|nr:permease [Geothermobacteraceae bacterium]